MPNNSSDWMGSLQSDIRHMRQIIDKQQKTLAFEKETKFGELKSLLQDKTEKEIGTPPNVMIASLLATLRRTYNTDQLAKAKWQLGELEQTLEQFDNLPYLWKQ